MPVRRDLDRLRIPFSLAVLLSTLALTASAARAQPVVSPPGYEVTLNPATFQAEAGPNIEEGGSPVSAAFSILGNPYYVTAGAMTTGYPNPIASSGVGGYGYVEAASSFVVYQFEVVPDPNYHWPLPATVPVVINGLLTASVLGPAGFARAQLQVDSYSGDDLDAAVCSQSTSPCVTSAPSTGIIAYTLAEIPDTANTVKLSTSASIGGDGDGQASADPSIYIDPSSPYANDFSIIVSDRIGNPSGIPEPSPCSILVVGLVALVVFSRPKKNRHCAAMDGPVEQGHGEEGVGAIGQLLRGLV
jgi:hypothetical protein